MAQTTPNKRSKAPRSARKAPPSNAPAPPSTSGRVAVKSVTIKWAEGRNEYVERFPLAFGSFAEAQEELAWFAAFHRPDHQGGYLKVGYVVEWADGSTYAGRLDVVPNEGTPRLVEDMTQSLAFRAGRWVPPHMTKERAEAFLDMVKADRAAAATMLDTLDMGGR